MEITLVTGNKDKSTQVETILGMPIKTAALDIPEVQSLSLEVVLEAKTREAYRQLQTPVIVDDVSMSLDEMKGLPGPFIKWFLDTIGPEGICRFADLTKTRVATAKVGIGYCDQRGFKAFIGEAKGKIAQTPKGTMGFGWDSTFVQEGFELTRAELSEEEYKNASIRKMALDALKSYLQIA